MLKLYFEVSVREDERGLLYRDGAFVRILPPGRHSMFDLGKRYTCDKLKVVRAEVPVDLALLLARTHPEVAADAFAVVRCGAGEVAIVAFDGDPKHFVMPNTTRAFWKVVTRVDVELVDAAAQLRVAKRDLDRLDPARNSAVVAAVVEAHEAGLLSVDGELRERLPPGGATPSGRSAAS